MKLIGSSMDFVASIGRLLSCSVFFPRILKHFLYRIVSGYAYTNLMKPDPVVANNFQRISRIRKEYWSKYVSVLYFFF